MVRVRAFLFRLGCGRLVLGTLILLGKEHGCPGVVRIPCVIYIFYYHFYFVMKHGFSGH